MSQGIAAPMYIWSVFVAAFSVFLYRLSFSYSFVFDDHFAIEGNPDVLSNMSDETAYNGDVNGITSASPWGLWGHDFWGRRLDAPNSHHSYRPVTVITFLLNHYISGFDPYLWHVTNVLLYALTCVCVLHYLYELLFAAASRSSGAQGRASLSSLSLAGAVAGAVFFAAHPVHVEAVASVVGRADTLAALFGLCAMRADRAAVCVVGGAVRVDPTLLLLSLALYGASFLSKESGICYPAMAIGHRLLCVLEAVRFDVDSSPSSHQAVRSESPPQGSGGASTAARARPASASANPPGAGASAWWVLQLALASAAPLTAMVFFACLRVFLVGQLDLRQSQLLRQAENPLSAATGTAFWPSVAYLNGYYGLLLFNPITMPYCCEYSFNCLPLPTAFGDPRVVASLVAFGVFGVVTSVTFTAGLFGRSVVSSFLRLTTFGLIWIVVGHIPASHVFVTVGTLVAERLLFASSVGLALCVGALVGLALHLLSTPLLDLVTFLRPPSSTVAVASSGDCSENIVTAVTPAKTFDVAKTRCSRPPPARIGGAALQRLLLLGTLVFGGILLLRCMSLRTIERTRDWDTDHTLFESALKVCPNSAKSHQQYALLQFTNHDYELGFQHLKRALAIDPSWCDPNFHIGRYYAYHQKIDEALEYLEKCLDCVFVMDRCLFIWLELYVRRWIPEYVYYIANPDKGPPEDVTYEGSVVMHQLYVGRLANSKPFGWWKKETRRLSGHAKAVKEAQLSGVPFVEWKRHWYHGTATANATTHVYIARVFKRIEGYNSAAVHLAHAGLIELQRFHEKTALAYFDEALALSSAESTCVARLWELVAILKSMIELVSKPATFPPVIGPPDRGIVADIFPSVLDDARDLIRLASTRVIHSVKYCGSSITVVQSICSSAADVFSATVSIPAINMDAESHFLLARALYVWSASQHAESASILAVALQRLSYAQHLVDSQVGILDKRGKYFAVHAAAMEGMLFSVTFGQAILVGTPLGPRVPSVLPLPSPTGRHFDLENIILDAVPLHTFGVAAYLPKKVLTPEHQCSVIASVIAMLNLALISVPQMKELLTVCPDPFGVFRPAVSTLHQVRGDTAAASHCDGYGLPHTTGGHVYMYNQQLLAKMEAAAASWASANEKLCSGRKSSW